MLPFNVIFDELITNTSVSIFDVDDIILKLLSSLDIL